MAVQAALLRAHPFAPFGFGGSPDVLGGTFGATDGGCCFEEDERAASAAEATRELLSFIDSASSNIKLALDKPGKSRRKVNHRKYLQKQIKRCGGLTGAAPPPPAPDAAPRRPPAAPGSPAVPGAVHGRAGPRREAGPAGSLQSRSLAALFGSLRPGPGPGPGVAERARAAEESMRVAGVAGPGPPGAAKVPLRARKLPASFFTEPGRAGPLGPSLGELEPGAAELLELLGPDYGAGADPEAGVLLAAEPLDVFPAAGLRAPLELEPGLFELPAVVGSLLYPEPWGAPGCPPAGKPSLAAAGGGLSPSESLRPLYPATTADSAGEDGPGPAAAFTPFFPDCTPPPLPPPHQASYDFSAGYSRSPYSGLWRPDGAWDGAPGEQGMHPD